MNKQNFKIIDPRIYSPNLIEKTFHIFKTFICSSKIRISPEKLFALNCLLSNLFVSFLTNKNLAVYRGKYAYSITASYGFKHYTFRNIVPLVDSLRDAGLILEIKGNWNNSRKQGTITRISGLNRLFQEQEEIELLRYPYKKVVLLRDKDKVIVPYTDTEEIKTMELFLDEYNEFIKSTSIQLPLDELTKKTDSGHKFNIYDIMQVRICKERLSAQSSNPLLVPILYKINSNTLHRVFNNSSFTEGGRFYGADYQQLKKEDRKKLLINFEKVVELDYSALHLNMLYNLEGKEYLGDPYSKIIKIPEMRGVLKKISLITLNSSSKLQAYRAFNYYLLRNPQIKNLLNRNDMTIEKLFTAFEEKHKDVAKYFLSGCSTKLQYLDSQIANEIMKYFIKEQKACLCIHDSFIVQEKYDNELREIMHKSYQKIIGLPCKIG